MAVDTACWDHAEDIHTWVEEDIQGNMDMAEAGTYAGEVDIQPYEAAYRREAVLLRILEVEEDIHGEHCRLLEEASRSAEVVDSSHGEDILEVVRLEVVDLHHRVRHLVLLPVELVLLPLLAALPW